jgi:hypothetical protein
MRFRVLGDKDAVSNGVSSLVMVVVVKVEVIFEWNHITDALILFTVIVKVENRGVFGIDVKRFGGGLAIQK